MPGQDGFEDPLSDGEADAPPGPAIFGLNGDNAIVFFSEPRVFARWHDDTLELLDWTVEGDVLSVRLDAGDVDIAVRRDGEISVVHPDGSLIDSIPDAQGQCCFYPNGSSSRPRMKSYSDKTKRNSV